MRIIQNFEEKELKNVLNDFYNYFSTGYEFEDFLKPFLESMGLTEVVVTKKTGDGGVDLIAVKDGLPDINNIDNVKYRVQAKRYAPTTIVSPEKIDALRGNLAFNEKGLFITTARVSEKAKEQAVTKEPYKPVFVIDGLELVRICIERQIGFAYKPIFSKAALDEFTGKIEKDSNVEKSPRKQNLNSVIKRITANDIRVHMISVPRYILDRIDNNKEKHTVTVIVNNEMRKDVTFCPSRNYLSAVTDILRKYELLQNDGTITEKEAVWSLDGDGVIHIDL